MTTRIENAFIRNHFYTDYIKIYLTAGKQFKMMFCAHVEFSQIPTSFRTRILIISKNWIWKERLRFCKLLFNISVNEKARLVAGLSMSTVITNQRPLVTAGSRRKSSMTALTSPLKKCANCLLTSSRKGSICDSRNNGVTEMTTYTILSGEGEMIENGLSLRDAAHEVLTSDSREYEVREDKDGGFTLWSRQQVANRPWVATRFFSVKTDRTEAEAEIFAEVVSSARFAGHCEAVTDEQYAEMLASLAEDDADFA